MIRLVLSALAILALLTVTREETRAQLRDVPIHDPVLAQAGRRFYLFGTGNGIRVWASEDLEGWWELDPVFPKAPSI